MNTYVLRRTLWIACLCCFSAPSVLAQNPPGFDFHQSNGFPFTLGDVVVNESNPFNSGDITTVPAAAGDYCSSTGTNTLMIYGDTFHKEFHTNNNILEYTFEYSLVGEDNKGSRSYGLSIDLVPGDIVEVMYNGHNLPKIKSHEVATGVTSETYNQARYVKVTRATQSFTVDLQPTGPWYDYTNLDATVRVAFVEVRGEELVLGFERASHKYGNGLLQGKLLFYNDAFDYEQIHIASRSDYDLNFTELFAHTFCEDSLLGCVEAKPFRNIYPNKIYGTPSSQPWGFTATGPVIEESDRDVSGHEINDAPVYRAFATHDEAATYRYQGTALTDTTYTSGLYMVTVIVGDQSDATDLMEISFEDGTDSIQIGPLAAGEFARKSIVTHFDEIVDIHLTSLVEHGFWKLNGIVVTPLLLDNENFVDAWWHTDLSTLPACPEP